MTTHEQMRRDCEDALAAWAWREAELRVATVNDSTYHTIREVAANAPRWVLQLLDEIADLREELSRVAEIRDELAEADKRIEAMRDGIVKVAEAFRDLDCEHCEEQRGEVESLINDAETV